MLSKCMMGYVQKDYCILTALWSSHCYICIGKILWSTHVTTKHCNCNHTCTPLRFLNEMDPTCKDFIWFYSQMGPISKRFFCGKANLFAWHFPVYVTCEYHPFFPSPPLSFPHPSSSWDNNILLMTHGTLHSFNSEKKIEVWRNALWEYMIFLFLSSAHYK